MAGWLCPLSDWLAAPPRRPRPLRPAITGAQVTNGTRPGATTTTGTGISATTGKVPQAKVLRRAGDPGDPRRRGRRRSPLHRRGRLRPTSCGTPLPTPGDSLTTEYGPRSDRTPALARGLAPDKQRLVGRTPTHRYQLVVTASATVFGRPVNRRRGRQPRTRWSVAPPMRLHRKRSRRRQRDPQVFGAAQLAVRRPCGVAHARLP